MSSAALPSDDPSRTVAGYLQRILTARVYDIAVETPLDRAAGLSERTGSTVLLKREDTQPVFSFKLRGAYNKMAQLSSGELRAGVVCASAGNHAQGVALSARRLESAATVVMPTTTPQVKVDAVAALGATVVLHGDSYSDAYRHALEIQAATGPRRSCTRSTTPTSSPGRARSPWRSCASTRASSMPSSWRSVAGD